jgi:hypothetical protein
MLSSSTPIGWTLLLRLVPRVGPPERLRLLPVVFAVAAVVAAYLLGRRLGRVQAAAAGLAAAIAPSALSYLSLKQYSADPSSPCCCCGWAPGSPPTGAPAGWPGSAWPACRRC